MVVLVAEGFQSDGGDLPFPEGDGQHSLVALEVRHHDVRDSEYLPLGNPVDPLLLGPGPGLHIDRRRALLGAARAAARARTRTGTARAGASGPVRLALPLAVSLATWVSRATPCCRTLSVAGGRLLLRGLVRRLLRGAPYRGPDQREPREQQRQQRGQDDQQPPGQHRQLGELTGQRLRPPGLLDVGVPFGALGGLGLERPGDRLTEPDELPGPDPHPHLGGLARFQAPLARGEGQTEFLTRLFAGEGDIDRGVPPVLHRGTEPGAQPAGTPSRVELGPELMKGRDDHRGLGNRHRLGVLRGQNTDTQRYLTGPDLVGPGRRQPYGHHLGGARVEGHPRRLRRCSKRRSRRPLRGCTPRRCRRHCARSVSSSLRHRATPSP